MERQRSIDQAKSTLRDSLYRKGKRNARIHHMAAADNLDRLRALNGICGSCEHLDPRIRYRDGKEVVHLHCKAGENPLLLYYNTELGKTANCPRFTPVDDNS